MAADCLSSHNHHHPQGGLKGDIGTVIYDSEGRKFSYAPKDWTVEGLRQFVLDFQDNKLEPYIKSEPIPAPSSDAVVTLVGRNFEEIVNQPGKDVFIEFYAPWCGHCKTLAPKWEAFAKDVAAEESIVVAKIDATANDFPQSQFPVSGFPTLYYVPASSKQSPIKYEGEREVKDFIAFVKKNASAPLKTLASSSKSKKDKAKSEL